MALGMSTQGSINSLLSSIPSTSVNATQTESTQTDEAANDSQGLPSMFAALLSQLCEIITFNLDPSRSTVMDGT